MSEVCRILSEISSERKPYVRGEPLAVQTWWGRRYHKLARCMVVAALAAPDEDFSSVMDSPGALQGQVLLDPFAGFGSVVVEAARLGCSPIGIDPNPLAWWVMHSRLLSVDVGALDEAVKSLIEQCANSVAHLFETACPICRIALPSSAYLWAEKAECTACHRVVRLVAPGPISQRARRTVYFCRRCDLPVEATSVKDAICAGCGTNLAREKDTVSYKEMICPFCGNRQDLKDDGAARARYRSREPFLVEVRCPEHGLQFKPLVEADQALLAQASEMLATRRAELLIPDTVIEPISTYGRRYGETYSDFFSPRQQLSLGLMLAEIARTPDADIRDALLSLFANVLNYNSLLSSYERMRGAVSAWTRVAAIMPRISAEANPWNADSRSSVAARYTGVVRPAKLQIMRRPSKADGLGSESYAAVTQAASITELDAKSVLLQCASPMNLPIPSGSVDVVVTMPPYFDNIPYTQLSNFMYVWLRLLLAKDNPYFAQELITSGIEMQPFHPSSGSSRQDNEETYVNNLRAAFLEIYRVLKADALFVLLYSVMSFDMLKTTLGWLLDAGFYVDNYCPLPTGEAAFAQSISQRWFTANSVFFCYKRGGGKRISWRTFEDSLLSEIDALFAAMPNASGQQVTEAIWGTFIQKFSQAYPNIVKADGSRMGVSEAVDWLASLAGVTSSASVDIRHMAEAQSVRQQMASGGYTEEELSALDDQLIDALRKAISERERKKIEAELRQALGEQTWDALEEQTREFISTAEYHYKNAAGKDLDFGSIAVAYTKPLENELRLKFCRHLAVYAQQHGLDSQAPRARKTSIGWDRLLVGDLMLGQIESLLREIERPENVAVERYVRAALPAETSSYAEHDLPAVIEEFREQGRNAGAHIDPVEQAVVDRLRSTVVGSNSHTRYWINL